ncbi:response regulator [Bradyrhizobium sp. SRL28]|uniref:response regulator n=1 Tax=Bradyrhizobium sp. SRL28 TaxID=2836178 RepID=UPI001BDE5990|nr:response regulator [Bradyrhizobium sp. SRL28]MBT1510161.1 response regulator [Bradyrhizobium sp. SRL28]
MLIETSAPRILYQASDLAAKPKILIADDDPQNLKALDAILAAPDREIVQARSGWEVLRCARENDFAVVVLDVRMPDLDGLQVAARMMADQRTSRIPVVFITANFCAPSMQKHHCCRVWVSVFGGVSPGAFEWLMAWPEGDRLKAIGNGQLPAVAAAAFRILAANDNEPRERQPAGAASAV